MGLGENCKKKHPSAEASHWLYASKAASDDIKVTIDGPHILFDLDIQKGPLFKMGPQNITFNAMDL